MSFAYVRRGLPLHEIESYIASTPFGTSVPDFGVLHHTAVPFTTWAPVPGRNLNEAWDAREGGLTPQQVYDKRLRQLDNIKNIYEKTYGWSAGPHAFIDEQYVWLMSPLTAPGIHAKWFNSFRDSRGRLHWSFGIEMVGCFSRYRWHPQQAQLLAVFVGALQRRLGTFALDELYTDPTSRPGMTIVNGEQRCKYPARLKWGGMTSHRYANKPECPGDAITDAYYLDVLRRGVGNLALVAPQTTPAPSVTPGRYEVTADVLNVRDKPALRGSAVVHQLTKGRIITVDVLKTDEGGDATIWAHMDSSNPEGDKGFVSTKYLRKVG